MVFGDWLIDGIARYVGGAGMPFDVPCFCNIAHRRLTARRSNETGRSPGQAGERRAGQFRRNRLGLDTASTVRNAVDWLGPRPSGRLLAVSHGYHLPRIKLCFQRSGREVFTVPARQRYIFPNQKLLTAREVAAFWWYYLLPGRG